MDKHLYHHEISEEVLAKQMSETSNPVTKASLRECLRARDTSETESPKDFDETNKHWWS